MQQRMALQERRGLRTKFPGLLLFLVRVGQNGKAGLRTCMQREVLIFHRSPVGGNKMSL
jgi:hypothetical protein